MQKAHLDISYNIDLLEFKFTEQTEPVSFNFSS